MRIKELIKKRGLTAKEVASIAGITEAMLSNVASGKGNPNLQTLMKIADALDVKVRELFDGAPLVEIVSCPQCGTEIRVAISHVKIDAVDMKKEGDDKTQHSESKE